MLTNPYDEVGDRRHRVRHRGGIATTGAAAGRPIAPRSVEVIDLARSPPRTRPRSRSTSGHVRRRWSSAGRRCRQGDGRLGFGVTLAAPALRSQWWFVNGDKGAGVSERYSIYNPTEDDVEVQPTYLGIPPTARLVDRSDRGAGPPGGDVHARRRRRPARRSPRRGVRHHGRVAVDRRRAGHHAHDRRLATTSVLLGGVSASGGRRRRPRRGGRHRAGRAGRGRPRRLQRRQRRRRR